MFKEDLITLGVKLETTFGVVNAPIAADYNIRAGGVEYSHTIAEYKRKYAIGTHSRDKSIMGKQTAQVSFHVDLAWGSALDVANPVAKLLNICGVQDTALATFGVRFLPESSFDIKTATIDLVEKDEGTTPVQIVTRLAGCMGNCRIVFAEVGQPVRLEFEIQGKLADIFDRPFGSIITPAFVSSSPTRGLSATITRGAIVQQIETMTLDFGNDLQPKTDPADPTGIQHFYIASREPKLSCNPYLKTLAQDPAYTEWKAGTTGLFTFSIGIAATDLFVLTIPVAQYIEMNPAVRNGGRAYEKSFLCVKNSDTGDDEWKLVQNVES
jgi:hypothetical protein